MAEKVAIRLEINKVFAKLLPQDKVTKVEEIIDGLPSKTKLAFVGDGINDALVLIRADVGVAMLAILNSTRALKSNEEN